MLRYVRNLSTKAFKPVYKEGRRSPEALRPSYTSQDLIRGLYFALGDYIVYLWWRAVVQDLSADLWTVLHSVSQLPGDL